MKRIILFFLKKLGIKKTLLAFQLVWVRSWYQELSKSIKENVELIYATPMEYVDAINKSGVSYDVLIIDGIKRNDCAFGRSTIYLN